MAKPVKPLGVADTRPRIYLCSREVQIASYRRERRFFSKVGGPTPWPFAGTGYETLGEALVRALRTVDRRKAVIFWEGDDYVEG